MSLLADVDYQLARVVHTAWKDYNEGNLDLGGFIFRLKGAIAYTEVETKLISKKKKGKKK